MVLASVVPLLHGTKSERFRFGEMGTGAGSTGHGKREHWWRRNENIRKHNNMRERRDNLDSSSAVLSFHPEGVFFQLFGHVERTRERNHERKHENGHLAETSKLQH